jgi:PAS domain S-box-containing protein
MAKLPKSTLSTKKEGATAEIAQLQERVRALEAALREKEKKLQEIYDEAPIGYHELNERGEIISMNRTELNMLGYSFGEVFGQPIWKFVVEEEMTRKITLAKLAGDVSFHETFERTYRRRDGSTLTVLVKDRIIKDQDGKISGIRSTVEDITERRRSEEALRKSEEQLRQWQKVEAIGNLAGGVAHDFSNLLMTIKGCTEILLRNLEPEDKRREEVIEIQKAAERATSLTRQLLAFARKQVLQPQVVNLNDIVTNMTKILQRIIGEDIQLATVLEPKLWPVKVDPGQMEQVIMNLALNARDAMPRGGQLMIETANVNLNEEFTRQHVSMKPGAYVKMTVRDTGCGMDKETLNRIFEPFFTTKEKGKGTGLGLSTVYGIIKQSGGNIWAASELGQGSTFTIYLPKDTSAVPKKYRPKPAQPPLPIRGTETILLVEDEAAVRSMLRQTLESNGYKVLEAPDGQEAINICQNYPGPIHLLLTDVIMPGMNGRELSQILSRRFPKLKVLFMSGYPDNSIVHLGTLEPPTMFLQKPFTLSTLEMKVREILDAREEKMVK